MKPERIGIPLVTVGGFLGAGKTTLVNRMLAGAGGRRIVVFVNDFGAVNIDYDLIEAADTDRISLKNGCVCCTLSDDLVASVVGFCRDDPPDTFVIEASGVSDPRVLDQSILALQSAGHVRLNNRIYVLDADRFGALDYADTEMLIDHAAACDMVLINKFDLVGDHQIRRLEAELERSTKDTAFYRTVRCDLAVDTLLDGPRSSCPPIDFGRDGPSDNHGDLFRSWSKTVDGPVGRAKFERFLADISGVALRAKGRIAFADEPRRIVSFHLVGPRFTIDDPVDIGNGGSCRFVVIGRKELLDVDALETGFARCLMVE